MRTEFVEDGGRGEERGGGGLVTTNLEGVLEANACTVAYIRDALCRIGDPSRGSLDILSRLAHELTALSARP